MRITLLLEFTQRQQLRDWLLENHASAKECWTELNKQRCQELESRGLMKVKGKNVWVELGQLVHE